MSSQREIGYGDVSVNKKMKEYVNLFFSIIDIIEKWDSLKFIDKFKYLQGLMNINKDNDQFVDYFDKYRDFLINNSLKIFTKDILEPTFNYGCTKT